MSGAPLTRSRAFRFNYNRVLLFGLWFGPTLGAAYSIVIVATMMLEGQSTWGSTTDETAYITMYAIVGLTGGVFSGLIAGVLGAVLVLAGEGLVASKAGWPRWSAPVLGATATACIAALIYVLIFRGILLNPAFLLIDVETLLTAAVWVTGFTRVMTPQATPPLT